MRPSDFLRHLTGVAAPPGSASQNGQEWLDQWVNPRCKARMDNSLSISFGTAMQMHETNSVRGTYINYVYLHVSYERLLR
jgi:hypothetical protein